MSCRPHYSTAAEAEDGNTESIHLLKQDPVEVTVSICVPSEEFWGGRQNMDRGLIDGFMLERAGSSPLSIKFTSVNRGPSPAISRDEESFNEAFGFETEVFVEVVATGLSSGSLRAVCIMRLKGRARTTSISCSALCRLRDSETAMFSDAVEAVGQVEGLTLSAPHSPSDPDDEVDLAPETQRRGRYRHSLHILKPFRITHK
ncbi:hypothetical protein DNTS_012131 [Danionella cerebrum]|uniref:Uncharacterized protein n=1 Tax=Danionella cerebrum TaxID=2873325 RepID=A0A553PUF1_9TELE|nr:hypothetical protein DNTS_012131 [Danionella translucida]